MNVGDLQTGDILISFTRSRAGGKFPASHAEIVIKKQGVAYSFHAMRMYRAGIQHVTRTRTKLGQIIRGQVAEADECYVCRPRIPELASVAAHQAMTWHSYHLPYEIYRLMQMEKYDAKLVASGLLDFDDPVIAEGLVRVSRQLFEQQGKYRAIKYATRAGLPACQLGDDEGQTSRGVTCSQFVIMCYQAAGLRRHVIALTGHDRVRASDKKFMAYIHGSFWDKDLRPGLRAAGLSENDIKKWKMYVERLEAAPGALGKLLWRKSTPAAGSYGVLPAHTQDSSPIWAKRDIQRFSGPILMSGEYVYTPSITFWKDKSIPIDTFSFEGAFTGGMCLDCKISSPVVLYASLLADRDGWDVSRLDYAEEFQHREEYDAEAVAFRERSRQESGVLRDPLRQRYEDLLPEDPPAEGPG